VLLVNLRLIWLLGTDGKGILGFLLTSLIAVVITSIASGAALAYFAIPAVLQPVHLLLASLLAGIQFALLLFINQKKVFSTSKAESTSKQYLYQ
jgi:cytochrome c oxidase assembly protein subunit 15